MRALLTAACLLALGGCGGGQTKAGSGGSSGAGASAGGARGGNAGVASGAAGGMRGSGAATNGGMPSQAGVTGGGNSGAAATTGGVGPAGNSSGGRGGAAGGALGGAPSAGVGAMGGAASGGASSGGMAGEAQAGGAGDGTGTPGICSFQISASISPDITTVGLVDWSTDLKGITAARIEFSLDDPSPDELNVGGGGPISTSDSRALMLGLKPGRSYTYRLIATAGQTECVSADHTLSTQTDPATPVVTTTAGEHVASRAKGFIVTCGYSGTGFSMILDTDGAVVWWVKSDAQCSHAHMDWDGQYLWSLSPNPTGGTMGGVRRVRMDGSGTEALTGLESAHHDFAVLPGGTAAFLVWSGQADESSDLVERSPDGTLRTIAALDEATLGSTATKFHSNALRYYARDDSYSLSDLSTSGIYKFNRQGQLTWQSSGYYGMHGHELLPNGDLLYFEAHFGSTDPSTSDPSPVYEYSFSGQGGTQTATQVWTYAGTAGSVVFGDVWPLPNGDTLVTYTTDSTINEVTHAGEILQSFKFTSQVGYTDFRATLYGPPQ